jgi:MFS transporter, DHA1 family, inner membrane transport protein
MTESVDGSPPQPNSTFWAAGMLGILATAVGAILPVLVGVWQKQAGLQVDEAGYVAATELFAQVAGTALYLWAAPRRTLRSLAAIGLGVMALGNIATAASHNFAALLVARTIGGTGGGLIRALCMMWLAKAASPARAFAVYASAQVALAAVTTALIPRVIDSYGVQAPFLALTLAAVLGIALCPILPRRAPVPASAHRGAVEFFRLPAVLAIAALLIFFAGQGALWTYLAPIGAYRSIPPAGVTEGLTLLNFAGLAGALGVGTIAYRVNARIALVTLLATEILAIVGLFQVQSSVGFIASVGVFYFSWCASFPFQFTVIAQSDRSGRASAAVPAADGLGLALGAAIASGLLPTFGLGSAGALCAAASVVGVTLYLWSAALSRPRMQGRE